jgi:hypothetical protein
MKPSIQTLGQILYSPSQYVIPVFQRNYRWETQQWGKLWDSLTEIQQADKRGNHFMGFLVFVPGIAQPGQHTTFYLIDGQQRLTTTCLILAALRNVARETDQNDLADEIHQYYLTHPLKKGEHHYRLLPKERDHDSYLAIIGEDGQPTGRMADALSFFEEKLSTSETEAPANLRKLFDTLCQRLEFMCATLESENAYNIFKSLNSTGVPLGASDLIRNFVFMHIPPEEQEEFDAKLWHPLESRFTREDGTLDEERFSRFFRDYLMSDGRYVPPRETFETFEQRHEATEFSPGKLARSLNCSAEDYEIICGQKADLSEEVTQALSGLNVLESSTTYSLLLSLFEKRRSGGIDSADLARCVEMLRGFILRRFVCGESSRGYGQMFVRALSKDSGSPLKTLEEYLLDRGWPHDQQFATSFVEFPLYLRGYTKEVLEALERSNGHKEPADLTATQVEHILPQTLSQPWIDALGSNAESIQAEWLHRPGNLTLSGYNQELWNHSFLKKKERYGQSNIVLTRELANYLSWTDHEILSRGKSLANTATEIWIGPKAAKVASEILEGADETTTRHELRLKFWTGLSEYLETDHPELPKFDIKARPSVRVPLGLRNIGVDLRFGIRDSFAGIYIWFWRGSSLPIWHLIRKSPAAYDSLIGEVWRFEQIEGRTRLRMSVEKPIADLRDERSWASVYQWLAEKLEVVCGDVATKLRAEMDALSIESTDR